MVYERISGEGHFEKLPKDEEIIRTILQSCVVEHDSERPDLFRAVFAYGSKNLECFVRKSKKEASAVIESARDTKREEGETTFIYKAFHAFLRGVANRMGEPLKYALRTENEKLILWARTAGDRIFQWQDVQKHEGGMHEFFCEISPVITKKRQEKVSKKQDVQVLMWELRGMFK